MVTELDIQKYEFYLRVVQKQLDSFFDEQSPYICCKEGCSHCCEKGEYPFSEIEFAYLMIGVRTLPQDVVFKIDENIKKLLQLKQDYKSNAPFMHACPFLLEKRCSLYDYRGIICRAHGLAFFSKENKLLVPACVDKGLNYANVYDFENSCISDEKYLKLGIKQEPLAHNVGLTFMQNNSFTKNIQLNFGEIKPMIEWFETKI